MLIDILVVLAAIAVALFIWRNWRAVGSSEWALVLPFVADRGRSDSSVSRRRGGVALVADDDVCADVEDAVPEDDVVPVGFWLAGVATAVGGDAVAFE